MPRFPIDSQKISDNKASIIGSDYKHITKVLRLKEGDQIDLFDDNSTEYRGKIKEINSREVIIKIYDSWETQTESNLQIDLYQSVIKPSKMDLIVQKSTELGISNIIPITTERTQKGLQAKVDRLNKISIESAKQCRRSKSPVIHSQTSFEDAINSSTYDLKLILYENSENSLKGYFANLNDEIKSVSVLIGPEGGFSEEEVQLAESQNFQSLGLGKRILRTETAAITVVSLIQFQFGDLG